MGILGIFKDRFIDRGNVKISINYKGVNTKDISIHNSGTKEACRFLRDCLVGEFNVSRRPGAIVPCKSNFEPIFGGLYYDDMIYEIVDVEGDDKQYAEAILEFNIPGNIYAGQEIGSFILYGFDKLGNRSEFARAKLSSVINLDPGAAVDTNLNIKWHIRISVK